MSYIMIDTFSRPLCNVLGICRGWPFLHKKLIFSIVPIKKSRALMDFLEANTCVIEVYTLI